MNIILTDQRDLSRNYLAERDAFWHNKIIEFNKKNQPLWNGSVYYLDNRRGGDYFIGLCEYKDVLFAESIGFDKIKQKYGEENNFVYINVQILIKDRESYIFGTKNFDEKTEIISVGGTLRLEDDDEIKSFEDIKKYAKKELDIETNLSIGIDDLKYLGDAVNNNICTFIFEYSLKKSIENKVLKIGEFDGEICLKKGDVFGNERVVPNIRLNSIKKYLIEKWKIK